MATAKLKTTRVTYVAAVKDGFTTTVKHYIAEAIYKGTPYVGRGASEYSALYKLQSVIADVLPEVNGWKDQNYDVDLGQITRINYPAEQLARIIGQCELDAYEMNDGAGQPNK